LLHLGLWAENTWLFGELAEQNFGDRYEDFCQFQIPKRLRKSVPPPHSQLTEK